MLLQAECVVYFAMSGVNTTIEQHEKCGSEMQHYGGRSTSVGRHMLNPASATNYALPEKLMSFRPSGRVLRHLFEIAIISYHFHR